MRYIITGASRTRTEERGSAMPDPALLALVQHFANPPPAIVQPAFIADAEPFLSAYEAIANEQDRDFDIWMRREAEVRETARLAVATNPREFTPQLFTDLIEPLERHMRQQQKITARLERRTATGASERLTRLRERTLARQRQQYGAAADLVLFLRAMRAEIDPESRGGPSFDDPDEIERYLLSAVA